MAREACAETAAEEAGMRVENPQHYAMENPPNVTFRVFHDAFWEARQVLQIARKGTNEKFVLNCKLGAGTPSPSSDQGSCFPCRLLGRPTRNREANRDICAPLQQEICAPVARSRGSAT